MNVATLGKPQDVGALRKGSASSVLLALRASPPSQRKLLHKVCGKVVGRSSLLDVSSKRLLSDLDEAPTS